MKKRLLSLFLAAMVFAGSCLSAFAADTGIDIIDNPLQYYFENQLLGVQKGTGVTLVCPNGDYSTVYTGGTLVSCPYDGEALVLAGANGVQAKKYQTGGGSAGTGGVGRRPSGYSENNTPNVTQAGELHFYAPVTGWTRVSGNTSSWFGARNVQKYEYEIASANATGSKFPSNTSTSGYAVAMCAFTAPVSGTYTVKSKQLVAEYLYLYSGEWKTRQVTSSYVSSAYFAGDSSFFYCSSGVSSLSYPFDAKGYGVDIYVTPTTSTINQTNNITINKNQWNGNIYQDNSTNLTYIYPQYTTINENNETVTNISENPIIYNNETNEYYTYDSVTNNYYYITYVTESPTPTPSPDPGTTPTPTPTPGGDTGNTGDSSGILAVLVEMARICQTLSPTTAVNCPELSTR